eukprot:4515654-Prorocentrum_lima.AAC.1
MIEATPILNQVAQDREAIVGATSSFLDLLDNEHRSALDAEVKPWYGRPPCAVRARRSAVWAEKVKEEPD